MEIWNQLKPFAIKSWCAGVCVMLGVGIAFGQTPAPVFTAQVYGRGNTDSLPGSGDSNLGKNATAVDAAGNIYVTGSTFNGLNVDFLTVKYNAAGAIQWRVLANGAANGDDFAYGIAVDVNGNVVVTGSSQFESQSDYLTVKYNSSGVEQWRATLDGNGNRSDEAYAVAVDAAGNVMVTGASIAYGNNFDYVTVKYSALGEELWRIPMEGAGNSIDRSVAMCVDASGNTIVTGYSLNLLNFDYVTVKYNPAGLEFWRRAMNGTAGGNDVAFAMACDSGGNIYVTGKSFNGSNYDYLTIKYDGDGFQQWRADTNGTGNADDSGVAIVVDAIGNVIVAGQSERDDTGVIDVTNPMHLAVKYNASNGSELWRTTLNGSGNATDVFSALATDAASGVFAAGYGDNNGANELVVVKYAPGGTVVWRTYVNGIGASNSAALMALRVDGSGNIIAIGYRNNGVDNDFLILKFDGNGNELWRIFEGINTTLTTTFASGTATRNAVSVDASGNVFVTGKTGNASAGEYVTAKFSSAGVIQWQTQFDAASGGVDRAYAVAVDGAGNAYVTGDSISGASSDMVTVKYDSFGVEQWRVQAGRNTGEFNSACAVAADASGNVIVVGYSSADRGYLTIMYAANGVERWRAAANAGFGTKVTPVAIAVDSSGDVVVTGHRIDGAQQGYLTVKYSSTGAEKWRAQLNGVGNEPRQVSAMAIDTSGNVVITGDTTVKYSGLGFVQWSVTDSFRANSLAIAPYGDLIVGGSGGMIVKYGADDGVSRWRNILSGVINPFDLVSSVAVDEGGGVYVAARSLADISGDYLIVKYGNDGAERWRFTVQTAGGGIDVNPVVALAPNRNIILVGNAARYELISAIFIAKYTQAPSPPTGVNAVAGNSLALVNFIPPPAAQLEAPLSSVSIVCQPGSITATGNSSPILVTGLPNDVLHVCNVFSNSVFGTSMPSADVAVTPTAGAPLTLYSVQSIKSHGQVGDFPLKVNFTEPINGAITIEPRVIGSGHKLLLKFNNVITNAGAASALDANSLSVGTVSAVPSGNNIEVTLAGVPDKQRLLIKLNGINGGTNVAIAMGFLVGDVNESQVVSAADISAAKMRLGQAAGANNFKLNVNASGRITAADISAIRSQSGMSLPQWP